jgi:hypothetical protein
LEASKPSAYLGARVDGGASGATSQITTNTFLKSKEAESEKESIQGFGSDRCNGIAFGES